MNQENKMHSFASRFNKKYPAVFFHFVAQMVKKLPLQVYTYSMMIWPWLVSHFRSISALHRTTGAGWAGWGGRLWVMWGVGGMLHVGSMYLHFPLNVANFHLIIVGRSSINKRESIRNCDMNL